MAKIYDFKTRQRTDLPSPETVMAENPSKPKVPKIDKETYLLWMFSKDVDDLITRYMFEHHLKAHELAAILSHRLGQLVATTEQPERLEEFCQNVLRRMALVSELHGQKHQPKLSYSSHASNRQDLGTGEASDAGKVPAAGADSPTIQPDDKGAS